MSFVLAFLAIAGSASLIVYLEVRADRREQRRNPPRPRLEVLSDHRADDAFDDAEHAARMRNEPRR